MYKDMSYSNTNIIFIVMCFTLGTIIIALIASCCNSNLPLCDEKSHPTYMNGSYITVKVGTVFTNGEYCDIEEVQQVFTSSCTSIDSLKYKEDNLHCKYCPTSNYPKVRRLICHSGKNGESTVGHDNTKNHNEVIQ